MENEVLDYIGLLKEFDEDRIADRCDWLNDCMLEFIRLHKLDDKVQVSEPILHHVIIDYYADIQRLKEFQKIEKVNMIKIFSYTTYWILRHKPLQLLTGDISEPDLFVNEDFCSELIRTYLFDNPASIPIRKENKDCIREFVDTMRYYFKYRDVSPKCIELMMLAFEAGRGYQASVEHQN